jgi:O-antigen/teichoic acid export membrane protein
MSTLLGSLARNVSLNVLLQAWLALLSLLTTPILYRRLGGEQYGLFAIVSLLISQLTVLEFGFGHATTRFIAAAAGRKDSEAQRRVVATSGVVFIAAGAAGAAALLFGSGFLIESYFRLPHTLRDTGRQVLMLTAALFFVGMLTNLLAAAFRGLQRFGTLNSVRGFMGAAQTLGAVAVVADGGLVNEVVLWTLLVAISGTTALALLLARAAPGLVGWPRLHRATFWEMAGFGGPLMLAGILNQLYLSGGSLALARFVALSALPFYAIPLGLFQRLQSVASAVATALLPMIAGLVDGGEATRLLSELPARGMRVLLVLALPVLVGGGLVARPFLTAWIDAGFASNATWPMQCALCAFVLVMLSVPWTEMERGSGRAWPLVAYVAILAALNLGATLLLAPAEGVRGAATALLIAQSGGTAFLLARSGQASGALAMLVGPGLVGALYGVSAVAASLVTSTLGGRLSAAIVLTIVYALAAWRFAFDNRDRDAILRVVNGSRR